MNYFQNKHLNSIKEKLGDPQFSDSQKKVMEALRKPSVRPKNDRGDYASVYVNTTQSPATDEDEQIFKRLSELLPSIIAAITNVESLYNIYAGSMYDTKEEAEKKEDALKPVERMYKYLEMTAHELIGYLHSHASKERDIEDEREEEIEEEKDEEEDEKQDEDEESSEAGEGGEVDGDSPEDEDTSESDEDATLEKEVNVDSQGVVQQLVDVGSRLLDTVINENAVGTFVDDKLYTSDNKVEDTFPYEQDPYSNLVTSITELSVYNEDELREILEKNMDSDQAREISGVFVEIINKETDW